jgi:hypothetical protein
MSELTHGAIHEQARVARELNDTLADGTYRAIRGVRLGAAQLDAIQQHHRDMSGMKDVGPVREFMGMAVLPSRSADRLVIEYEGDPEDEDAPTTVNVPPPPELAEEQPQ